mmetsp:Transcript_24720/g.62138  ORF Transcript_24720/g.62138 Transcript_24720/m.62138 type:complete len:127 (+) Transcript_24720:1888-2268(+)
MASLMKVVMMKEQQLRLQPQRRVKARVLQLERGDVVANSEARPLVRRRSKKRSCTCQRIPYSVEQLVQLPALVLPQKSGTQNKKDQRTPPLTVFNTPATSTSAPRICTCFDGRAAVGYDTKQRASA